MDGTSKWIRSGDVVAKQLPHQVVLLELSSGEYFSLEAVSMLVWDLLDGTRSLDELAEQVAQHYQVEAAQARQDVLELMQDLCSHQLILPA